MTRTRITALHRHARFSALFVLTLLLSAALGIGVVPSASAASTVPASVGSYPRLRYGSRGDAVAWLQGKLHVSPRSGWFGPLTVATVKSFQKRHRLSATGTVTASTWRALGVRYVPVASKPATAKPATSKKLTPGTTEFGTRVMAVATTQTGKRYRRGGNGPTYFDCSGLVKYVYSRVGYPNLPRTSSAMASTTRHLSAAQVRVGDLVFVHNGGAGRVGHVAIYAGNGYWFEASNPSHPVGRNKAWSKTVSYGRVA